MGSDAIFNFALSIVEEDNCKDKCQLSIIENIIEMIDNEDRAAQAVSIALNIKYRKKVSEFGLYYIGALRDAASDFAKEAYPVANKFLEKFENELASYYNQAAEKFDVKSALTVIYPTAD